MRLLFLFLLCLIPSNFALCPVAARELAVPAIVEPGVAEMVRIAVETRPGKGEVFVSTEPAIGYWTQLSERIARDVAFAATNTSACDVFLRIFAPAEVSHVDGPSGGAAITLMLLAALRGETLRPDFSITGTIERDGSIGPVGEIPAKAEAAARAGRAVFLVPKTSYEEKLALLVIGKVYKIAIGEVSTISEAYDIAVRKAEPEEISLEIAEKVEYAKSRINHTNVGYFRAIAQQMVEQVGREAIDSEAEHFISRVKNAQRALETGHVYTAANDAFILKIDIAYINYTDANYGAQKSETKKCIANYFPEKITFEHFELNGAADMRWIWAKEKLKEVERAERGATRLVAKLEAFRELLTARYWCEAAHLMKVSGGSAIDARTLEKIKALASESVERAAKAARGREDAYIKSHLTTARRALDEGLYIAALIDAAYVTAAVRAVEETIPKVDPRTYVFLWPQLYADHGSTIEDERAAGRLYALAEDVERSLLAIEELLAEAEVVTPTPTTPVANVTNVTVFEERIPGISVVEVVAIIVLSVIIIGLILKRRE